MSRSEGMQLRAGARLGSLCGLLVAAVGFAMIAANSVFRSGYILEVDTAWGPHSPPLEYGFYLPIAFVVHVAVNAVGGATTGKAYVLAALALCAAAAMVALRRLPLWIRVVAGGIAVFNPWVYERIVEGQWVVVAAAASLMLWLAAFERLEERPGACSALLVALAAALVVAFSPGFLAMLAILVAARFAFGPRRTITGAEDPARSEARRRWTRLTLLLTAAFLLYGFALFVFGHGAESLPRVQTFGKQDLQFFRAQGLPLGLPIRLVGLAGFWAERTGRFESLDTGWVLWPAGAFALAAATCAGAWRRRERLWLLYAGLIGLALSASTDVPQVRTIVAAIGRHVPAVLGFREPQKFSALWLVATVVLVGALLGDLHDLDHRRAGRSWRAPVAALGIVAALVGLGAGREPGLLSEALRPVSYPADWYHASAFLEHNRVTGSTAVLPWHHYLPLSFAGGRIVQNPADVFFPVPVLVSEDPEIGVGAPKGAYADIGRAAAVADRGGCALAGALRARGVRQVIVLPVLEGPADLAGLRRCGFGLVEGSSTTVAIVRDGRRA